MDFHEMQALARQVRARYETHERQRFGRGWSHEELMPGFVAWSHRMSLNHCEVAQRDGMAAVREWLGDPSATVVHIDPFEPFTRHGGGPSAIEMAAEVADAGHMLVYWYEFDNTN